MDQKQTNNWGEMSSDDEEHRPQEQENPNEEQHQQQPPSESTQISMARSTHNRKPQLSREEMIEKIKTFKGKVYLNLLNVDYKATEEDLMDLYKNVGVLKIETTQQRGIFLMLVENAEEALKLFEDEEKILNGRKISVRLSAPKKREDYEGNYNKQKRPQDSSNTGSSYTGGYKKNYGDKKPYNNNKDYKDYKDSKNSYNRKEFHEPKQFGDEGGYQAFPKRQEKVVQKEEVSEKKPEETNRKPIGFTRAGGANIAVAKPEKKEEQVAKPQKSNPFGSAKARDENEYVKKKKEEHKSDFVEEIKELKGTPLEKVQPAPVVKVEEKPKVVYEKNEEDEYVVGANKKKGNKKNIEKAPVVQKEAPKVEENPTDKKPKQKKTTTENMFSQLAGNEEDEEEGRK